MAQDIIPAGSFFPAVSGRQEEGLGLKATRQLFFVIFKWQRLIIGLFLAFTMAAGIAMCIKSPVRKASAKIMLKSDRMPLRLSGMDSSVNKAPFMPQILKSEIQLILSREVLLPVAKKILTQDGKRSEKDIDSTEIEGMIMMLRGSTVPVPVPDTNVIEVTYFAPTNQEAKRNLELIVDQYLEEQAAIQSGSSKLLMFYEQEKERVAAELRGAEDKLKEWQEKNRTISIGEQISGQLRMLDERAGALQRTDADIEATRTRIALLQKQTKSQPERIMTSRDQVLNPLVTKLKNDLSTAEVALQDLLQRYTEKDRRVIEKKEQIAMLKKELGAAEKEEVIGRETTAVNPLRENTMRELAAAQVLLTGLGSQKEVLQKQVQDSEGALAAMREKQVEISRLSRAVDVARDSFMAYSRKLEEARLGTGLGKEQLANVAIIEKPYALLGTDWFKRLLIVFLAAFVGLALGAAVAIGLEFFNNSIRTQDDVEHYLGLPMLAAIPDLGARPLPQALES